MVSRKGRRTLPQQFLLMVLFQSAVRSPGTVVFHAMGCLQARLLGTFFVGTPSTYPPVVSVDHSNPERSSHPHEAEDSFDGHLLRAPRAPFDGPVANGHSSDSDHPRHPAAGDLYLDRSTRCLVQPRDASREAISFPLRKREGNALPAVEVPPLAGAARGNVFLNLGVKRRTAKQLQRGKTRGALPVAQQPTCGPLLIRRRYGAVFREPYLTCDEVAFRPHFHARPDLLGVLRPTG